MSQHSPIGSGADPRPAGAAEPVEIRPLRSHPEMAAAVALQHATWGPGFRDVVPASILKVALEVGGVALGAFSRGGDLVGFVFGLTGPRDGGLAHWSHLLAVDPVLRDRGIGSALKRAQAALLAERGVGTMHWTFDPLVARNAHLNLNHLGIAVARYVPDMYGDTGSPAHAFGTDRFVATWELSGDRPARRRSARARKDPPHAAAPVWTESLVASEDDPGPLVRIPVPTDIEAIGSEDPDAARAWRRCSRAALEWALGSAYVVIGFQRGAEGGDGHYILSRDPSDREIHEA